MQPNLQFGARTYRRTNAWQRMIKVLNGDKYLLLLVLPGVIYFIIFKYIV